MQTDLHYKGYNGEWHQDEGIFIGVITGLSDVVIFQGETLQELINSFYSAVDDYISYKNEGKTI